MGLRRFSGISQPFVIKRLTAIGAISKRTIMLPFFIRSRRRRIRVPTSWRMRLCGSLVEFPSQHPAGVIRASSECQASTAGRRDCRGVCSKSENGLSVE